MRRSKEAVGPPAPPPELDASMTDMCAASRAVWMPSSLAWYISLVVMSEHRGAG